MLEKPRLDIIVISNPVAFRLFGIERKTCLDTDTFERVLAFESRSLLQHRVLDVV